MRGEWRADAAGDSGGDVVFGGAFWSRCVFRVGGVVPVLVSMFMIPAKAGRRRRPPSNNAATRWCSRLWCRTHSRRVAAPYALSCNGLPVTRAWEGIHRGSADTAAAAVVEAGAYRARGLPRDPEAPVALDCVQAAVVADTAQDGLRLSSRASLMTGEALPTGCWRSAPATRAVVCAPITHGWSDVRNP